jgi:4-hydroxybenzoate polyprenyltransferase
MISSSTQIATPPGVVLSFARALRPHQWAKNLLVFVPLFASHRMRDLQPLTAACAAFVCFCACASAVYLLNDLMDVEADRRHSSKKNRPFASGALPTIAGWIAAPALGAAAIMSALPVSRTLAWMLCLYIAVSIAYSAKLKRMAALDVLVLAGLYTIRLYAGGAAANVAVSSWLAAFSMFLFLSLAFLKRYVELSEMRLSEGHTGFGRGYYADDQIPVAVFGCASGYIAVLVYALYVSSPHVAALYSHPDRLWFICPLLLYWITRIWLLATRGKVHDDPLIFALRDIAAYVTVALTGLVSFWAL